ncbi:MAG: alpha/beta hydrolase-fold protein [Calditrichia bacterium]
MKDLSIFLLLISIQFTVFAQSNDQTNDISIGQTIEIESRILGETRQIFVHQPKGFWGMDEAMSNFPVVLVLDGESQFLHTVSTVDFLSSAPLGNDIIPRSLVVGIANTNRDRDLTPIKGVIANDSTTLEITGGGKTFLSFITEELIPFIEANYSTSNHRTIIGHSLGGLIAFEALLRKRGYFNNYIAIDPGLGYADEIYMQEVLDTLNHADLSTENLYFAAGNTRPTFLTDEDLLTDDSDFMKLTDIPNRKFINETEKNEWSLNLTSKHYPADNHFSIPLKATDDALRTFYQYYSFPEIIDYYHPKYKNKSGLIEKIEAHYKMISSKMGYEVIPMVGYINSFAFGIAPSGRMDLAIALFEYNIELHPNNPVVYNNIGYFYMSQGNKQGALKAFKKSVQLKFDDYILGLVESLEKEIADDNKG